MSNFEVSIQYQPSLEHNHFPKESGNNRRPGFSLRQLLWPFIHVSIHEYYGDNFISKPNSNPNPRYI